MKVFSKEMFIKDSGIEAYEKCKEWVDACDGKRVIGGEVGGYLSDKAWEKEVDAK
jgi:hypothetical protein